MNKDVKKVLEGKSVKAMVEGDSKSLSEATFRDFKKSDWDGLAGAEEYPDGTPPRIVEIKVPMEIVADANGIEIHCGDLNWRNPKVTDKAKQDAILQKLDQDFEPEELGFKLI